MRLIFAGTPEFAVPVLEALARRHEVAAILTQPDRPKGRSLRTEPTPVKVAADKLGIPALQPDSLRDESVVAQLADIGAQAIVVVAYGKILPRGVLDLTPVGCINIHPSLLPAYRGAAPIQRAIINGDDVTGISVMQLDEGMDTGPVYAQSRITIEPDETAGELAARLDHEATELLLAVLEEIELGTAVATPQSAGGVSVAEKVSKEDAVIDWRKTAREIHNQVRALNPVPGAFTSYSGRRIKVWRTNIEGENTSASPGEISRAGDRLDVDTGSGIIALLEVQPESKGRMSAAEFVRGYRLRAGHMMGSS